MSNHREKIRQYISRFINGKNANALIDSLADEAQKQEDLQIAINNQLTASTAEGIYLDKRLANVNLNRPLLAGIRDKSFRDIGTNVTGRRKLEQLIHEVLEDMYGADATRSHLTTDAYEPYNLTHGEDLTYTLEDQVERTLIVNEDDFTDISNATAQEVANVLTRHMRDQGTEGFAQSYYNERTRTTHIRAYGSVRGPYSQLTIIGGEANLRLQFPSFYDTSTTNANTLWEITRPEATTYRFRWFANDRPVLDEVKAGDRVYLYGPSIKALDIEGTYTVTASRTAEVGPDVLTGWFEIDDTELYDKIPALIHIGATVPFMVTSDEDIRFQDMVYPSPNNKYRYSMGYEAESNTLKVYMPATTQLVGRGEFGGSYLHMGQTADTFDGVFGAEVDNTSSPLTGAVTVVANSNVVTGLLTTFTIEVSPDDLILIGSELKRVATVVDATTLTLHTNHSAGAAGVGAYIYTSVETELDDTIEIINDKVIRYKQNAYDNVGEGGTVQIVAVNVITNDGDTFSFVGPYDDETDGWAFIQQIYQFAVDSGYFITPITGEFVIERIWRENGFVTVQFTEDHGLQPSYTIKPTSGGAYEDHVFTPLNGTVAINALGNVTGTLTSFITDGIKFGTIIKVLGEELIVSTDAPITATTFTLIAPHSQGVVIAGTTAAIKFNPAEDSFEGRKFLLGTAHVAVDYVQDDIQTWSGPYMVDPEAPYILTKDFGRIRETIEINTQRLEIEIDGVLPNQAGLLLFSLDGDNEETAVPYRAVVPVDTVLTHPLAWASQIANNLILATTEPHKAVVGSTITIAGTGFFDDVYIVDMVFDADTVSVTAPIPQTVAEVLTGTFHVDDTQARSRVMLDKSYQFKYEHVRGQDVTVIEQRIPYVPHYTGRDNPSYITGIAEAREFAVDIIEESVMFGIKLDIVILYPSDKGLGNEGQGTDGDIISDKVGVWG